jgi:hypothetical protein
LFQYNIIYTRSRSSIRPIAVVLYPSSIQSLANFGSYLPQSHIFLVGSFSKCFEAEIYFFWVSKLLNQTTNHPSNQKTITKKTRNYQNYQKKILVLSTIRTTYYRTYRSIMQDVERVQLPAWN